MMAARFESGHYSRVLIATLRGGPVDIAHERGHVRQRIGTELDVISVFVHVESKDWNAARDALGMIGETDIHHASIARHIGQKDPSSITTERFRESDELGAPAIYRAEIARNCCGNQL